MYRPLPDSVTIAPSTIDGLGLFATQPIPKDTVLGITHLIHTPPGFETNADFQYGLTRLPLGGFFNHSVPGNCHIRQDSEAGVLRLVTSRDIEAGEELTATYTHYAPGV